MTTRATLIAFACSVWAIAACGEQRLVLFDGAAVASPDGGARDGAPDGVVLDASNRDPERCGSEAVHCEDDEYCALGSCVCREHLTRVGDDCVDTNADGEHCGGAGISCPGVCADGACVGSCPAGTADCEGACVDLSDHPLHCGECGRPCGSGRLCIAGSCVPFRPATCVSCPCDLCGTRTCCNYPTTTDPVCVDGPTCVGE